jgi:squalene-hopene/tetraprenyl-beta-curcumene cyclase
MQGMGGVGAIFPAMANAVMALKTLGYPEDHPDLIRGINAVDNLLVTRVDEAFCQPCHSPVWDTCLSLSALLEAGFSSSHPAVTDGIDWLFEKRICVRGDWACQAHNLEPFAWAFQFENNFYPDLDDTASVLMAFLRSGVQNTDKHKKSIAKAVNWIVGMQSTDGGWGAFDIDSNSLYLNQIPFADHGALLDPSTPDLTARCIELLAAVGYGRDFPPITRGLEFLRREQHANGAWFGRWGVNYIYGTWSVLIALNQVGEDMSQPYMRKAVDWLKSCQNPDNGWGETCDSYNDPALAGKGSSTPSQTAWAVLGLMAAGEVKSAAVQYGINYLCKRQNARGGWYENLYTGTGFPGVFYLRYHGYSHYFPLWAIGVYRRLKRGGRTLQDEMKLKSPAYLDLPEAK